MKKLNLGELALPLDAVSQTTAILGIRNSGKTNTAGVIVEEALDQGIQVVVLDPLDVWWGLKAAKDGKKPGYPITVLGGNHSDLPLLPSDGNAVADAIVEHGASVIISLRHLSKSGQRSFVADFAERLYHRKGESGYATPIFVVIDEADAFVPQKVFSGVERVVGAIDDLVRRGRASGIGVCLISQRAAVINKDVLTQIEMLVAHRHTSPHDRNALKAWIEEHGDDAQQKQFLRDLGGLPQGTAYVWSPGWLDIFKRVKIRSRHTFDSSSTPKIGQRRVEPKKLAAGDIAQFRKNMAETIEKAKENDPRLLKAELTAVRRELEQVQKAKVPRTVAKIVEKPVVTAKQIARLDTMRRTLVPLLEKFSTELRVLNTAVEAASSMKSSTAQTLHIEPLKIQKLEAQIAEQGRRQLRDSENRGKELPVGEQAVLIAVASTPSGLTREGISVMTGYKRSTRDAYIQRLKERGYIIAGRDKIEITLAGRHALPDDYEEPPVGKALRQWWLNRLPEGEKSVLHCLIQAHPAFLDRDTLSEQTGYKRSTRDAYIQRLKSRQLVVVDRDGIQLSDMLRG